MEYAVAWDLLSSAAEPPRGGDELAGIWMVHWSDATGRIWKGHIIEGRSSGHSRTSSPALTNLGPHDLPQNRQPDIAAIADGFALRRIDDLPLSPLSAEFLQGHDLEEDRFAVLPGAGVRHAEPVHDNGLIVATGG